MILSLIEAILKTEKTFEPIRNARFVRYESNYPDVLVADNKQVLEHTENR